MADQIEHKEKSAENKETQLDQDSSATTSQTQNQDTNMTPNNQTPTSTSNNAKNGLIYATLLLSAGAFGLSGWQFYQAELQEYDTKLARISQSNAKLETILAQQTQAVAQVAPIQSSLSKVIPALKKLETDGQNIQENSAKLGSEITSVRKQLSRLKNTSKEDWKLAEAEYLVRLANQRLLMEKDISGAEQLLVSADTILAEMKDPILFDTRRALAKDIQALKSTRSFDLEGVYLQLDALSSLVNSLPQKEPSKLFSQNTEKATPEDINETGEVSYAKALAQDIWQTLRSLVVINYNSKPIKPLLPPTEYQQLITGIQLQVNVAQLALMKQESSVYQIALEHIANAVNEHFDIDSAAVSGYLTSLTALQQINVSPELPLPRGSLASMKDLMQNWNGTGKNNRQAIQAPAETLGITQEQDIVAKPQAQDVPELIKVVPKSAEAVAGSQVEEQNVVATKAEELTPEPDTQTPSVDVQTEQPTNQQVPDSSETSASETSATEQAATEAETEEAIIQAPATSEQETSL
jgi:uroporphyrin-3 C-methyltransferase